MASASPPLKRFYETASAAPADDGFAVLLDARPLRTPAKRGFVVPTLALAQAVAEEWAGQGGLLDASSMPLTRIANVALDLAETGAPALADEVAKYVETDLVCHRAEAPAALAGRQAAAWDPLLEWARESLGVRLACTAGVIAIAQPAEAAATIRAAAAALDPFRLTGLAHATGLSGSAVIGFAMARGRLSGQAAFQAAFLDDLFQLERWGEDGEARARLDRLAGDLTALERWFALLG